MLGSADPSEALLALSRRQKSPARRHAIEALAAGLRAVDPRTLLKRHVRLEGQCLRIDSRSFDLSKFDRLFVLGGGKASALMASELERILGDRITRGLVNVPSYIASLPRTRLVTFHKATHPLPGVRGVKGVEKMLAMTRNLTKRDSVICVLSGGGSSLMPLPMPGLSISDKVLVTDLLLKSGARIEEINTVRKHLSAVKGGRLAELLYPATVIVLVISDVVSDSLDSIASGPLAPDHTTFGDAKLVLRKYVLWDRIPEDVRYVIDKGRRGLLPETPKKESKVFKHVHSFILGSNRDSCMAATRFLRTAGYRTQILSTRLQGEARDVGSVISSLLRDAAGSRFELTRPFALVAGGETTVTVKGAGLGGRNQELVLSAALGLAGEQGFAVGSMDTDGIDGPTRAAGAIASEKTVEQATRRRLKPESFLERNDSYHFFAKFNSLIITGPTGTNVGDILVAVAPA
jgi:glycerate 2-kinase